jgi:X-Pro dipeptidyl-peptidase
MIGKSYDGTLSNGVAATGVEGLKTIVPISAISTRYSYSRTGGVRNTAPPSGGAGRAPAPPMSAGQASARVVPRSLGHRQPTG